MWTLAFIPSPSTCEWWEVTTHTCIMRSDERRVHSWVVRGDYLHLYDEERWEAGTCVSGERWQRTPLGWGAMRGPYMREWRKVTTHTLYDEERWEAGTFVSGKRWGGGGGGGRLTPVWWAMRGGYMHEWWEMTTHTCMMSDERRVHAWVVRDDYSYLYDEERWEAGTCVSGERWLLTPLWWGAKRGGYMREWWEVTSHICMMRSDERRVHAWVVRGDNSHLYDEVR